MKCLKPTVGIKSKDVSGVENCREEIRMLVTK